nr:S24 family peptidase [uncultured Halomonas sp.]
MSVKRLAPAQRRHTRITPEHTERRGSNGFPSPADDYREAPLDLNLQLIPHPASTFFMRVEGQALAAEGFAHGDLLIVDRAQTPYPGHWVVAVIDGQLALRKLEGRGHRRWLRGSDARQARLPLDDEGDDRRLWGLVCHVVHDCRHGDEAQG